MNKQHTIIDQTLFNLKLNEAKLYVDQGLTRQAFEIYNNLLKTLDEVPKTKSTIRHKKQLKAILSSINNKTNKECLTGPASTTNKKSNQSLFLEAKVLLDLECYEAAISIYKTLIKHNFKLYEAMYAIIECNKMLEKLEDSKNYFTSLVKDPGTTEKAKSISYYFLSFLYEESGDYDNALALMDKITKVDEISNYENRKNWLSSKIKGKTKFDYLIAHRLIGEADLQTAIDLSEKNRKSVEYNLVNSYSIEINALGKSISAFFGYPFKDLSIENIIKPELYNNLKYKYLKRNHWAPIAFIPDQNLFEVAIANPDMAHQEDIRKFYTGYKLKFYIAIREHIDEYIDRQYNREVVEDPPDEDVVDFMSGISADIEMEYDNFEDDDDDADDVTLVDSKVIMFVNKMIVDAYRRRASDIHIEPSTHIRNAAIRFRIDGVCQPYVQIPNSFSRPIISRIKVMARMDIMERRKPLDGKIKFKSKSTDTIELRVVTIPTSGAKEDLVIRLLPSGKPMPLAALGVYDYNLSRLLKIIKSPYGLILAVGPTGSGKTTTLHSALNLINTPERKIWTAEDPIEIDQRGIRQTEINRRIGLDFAALLRSFLRADPDVIMVGEMRDTETAKIAVEASLTGHLVFSTLHTNNAPATVTRLLEMAIDPSNFADSLLGILAQRLGRRLCERCKQKVDSPQAQFDRIISDFGADPLGLLNQFKNRSIALYEPVGCNACGNTGYSGRIGFHELLVNNDEIRTLIKQHGLTEDIRLAAEKNNMYSLKQDGTFKVLQGITDMAEVRRICI